MPKSIVFDLPGNSLGDPDFYARGPVPSPDEENPVKIDGQPLVTAPIVSIPDERPLTNGLPFKNLRGK